MLAGRLVLAALVFLFLSLPLPPRPFLSATHLVLMWFLFAVCQVGVAMVRLFVCAIVCDSIWKP